MATRDMPDGTRWWRERPVQTLQYYSDLGIGGLITVTVCDLPHHDIVIERLVWATNEPTLTINVAAYNYLGVIQAYLRNIEKCGASARAIYPTGIHDSPSDIIDELHYDADNNCYKLALNRKLRFAHGLQIQFQNTNAAARLLAYQILLQDKGVIP